MFSFFFLIVLFVVYNASTPFLSILFQAGGFAFFALMFRIPLRYWKFLA